jgi:UDPglucose--hexose-1-phosphate uridylyltransferase
MRSPDKLKYLAGFESGGGNIINPVKPDEAADRLRQASVVHYKRG